MGLMLLSVCSSGQEDRAERSLSKLAGAAKLSVFDSAEGRAAMCGGLKRLEKWAERMLMSRGNCQVLQLERNKARHEYRLCLGVWEAALWRRAQGSWWP